MKKYRVYGTTIVGVSKEVWANSEEEAIERAGDELYSLSGFAGNGGWDKLVGVSGHDESVSADGEIEWDDTKVLEDDPDYRECLKCYEELDECVGGNGEKYWECPECGTCYDEDYNQIDPEDYVDSEEEN